MSYIALVTDRFDAMARFYGEALKFPALKAWDRPDSRGRVFDLGLLRLEILDNAREKAPFTLGPADGRTNLVVETSDVHAAHDRLNAACAPPRATSWGASCFSILDPDGHPVTFLQWLEDEATAV